MWGKAYLSYSIQKLRKRKIRYLVKYKYEKPSLPENFLRDDTYACVVGVTRRYTKPDIL